MSTELTSDSAGHAEAGALPVSVIVSTRDRPTSVAATVASILGSTSAVFELIVVDQSETDTTSESLRSACADPRLHYVRSKFVGVSRGRNEGVRHATMESVLITDDDVTVPQGWVEHFAGALMLHDRVGVAFCRVDAGEHDPAKGFIPDNVINRDTLVRHLAGKHRIRGIGAGMAVRRSVLLQLGGFDEQLGPGACLRSGEDRDVAIRALIKGWQVYQTNDVFVVHHGFRSWEEGRLLTERDWFGLGATYVKPVRVGRPDILPALLREVVVEGLLKPVVQLFRLRRPQGLMRLKYFAQGALAGWRTPLDRTHLRYEQRND